MNKKAVLNWLGLLVLITSVAYVPRTAASLGTSTNSSTDSLRLSEKSSQFALEGQRSVLADSDDPDDDDRDDDRDDDDDPDGPDDPDNNPTPEPPLDSAPESPLIPTQSKPTILDQSNWSPPQPLQPILGYTFPSGISDVAIPVRAAAFIDITPDPSEQFTPVGMVEIGANPETETESQIYLVSIDLTSRENRVKGQLVPVTPPDIGISPGISSVAAADTLEVIFQRIPQRLNPARTNSPYEEFQGLPLADNMATIFADGVCFAVKTDNGTDSGGDDDSDDSNNDDSNSGPIYNTYCNPQGELNGSDDTLSVMDNFPSQYAELQSSISDVAASFNLENRIQTDEVISTLESILGIQACANSLTEEACSSDVLAAPVTEWYFAQQLNNAFGENGDGNRGEGDDDRDNGDHESQTMSRNTASNAADDDRDDDDRPNQSPTPIVGGVMRVLKPIEFPDDSIVQPGDYVIHLWFDSNGAFFAATLTGITTDSTVVTNQQIPGVPATFIDKRIEEGPKQPSSQISALKLTWRGNSVCLCREGC